MSNIRQYLPFLPDPRDKSDTHLRPVKRLVGDYRFSRLPEDDKVTIHQPDGESYELVYFEAVAYLKSVLMLDDETRRSLLDRLWDFHHVELTLTEDGVDGYVRTLDIAPVTEVQEVAEGTFQTVDPF